MNILQTRLERLYRAWAHAALDSDPDRREAVRKAVERVQRECRLKGQWDLLKNAPTRAAEQVRKIRAQEAAQRLHWAVTASVSAIAANARITDPTGSPPTKC